MPLLSYFVVVGSALIGLLYLANAVMPGETPTHINAKSKPRHSHHVSRSMQLPCPLQVRNPRCRLRQFLSRHQRHVEEPTQKLNAPPAPVAQDAPPQKKRKLVPRKREWRDDFTQANSWSRDYRRGATGGGATTVGAMLGAIRFGARTGAGRVGVGSPEK